MAAFGLRLLSTSGKCIKDFSYIRNYSLRRCPAACVKVVHSRCHLIRTTGERLLTAAPIPDGNMHKDGGDAREISENEKRMKEEMDKLNKELDSLRQQTKDFDDRYKRSLAENENMRKRLQKQIEDAKLFGIQGFCKDLLEVSDILSKATESVPSEALETNQHLKSLFEGVKMTEAQVQAVFKRHGLTQINPLGEKFDPNFHEALFEQVADGKPPGTVVTVTKIGYKLHDRVIRPALVGVAKTS